MHRRHQVLTRPNVHFGAFSRNIGRATA